MKIQKHHVVIHQQLRLKLDYERSSNRTDRTHIEDVKDPVEVQLPGSNPFFIVLCTEESRGCISPTVLDDLSLNLGHGSGIEKSVSQSLDVWMVVSAHVVNC